MMQFAVTLLALTIIFVSFSPLCRMEGGFKYFCHKAKYLLAMVSGLMMIYAAAHKIALLLVLIFQVTLFMFIWPRIVWWAKNIVRPRLLFWYELGIKPRLESLVVPAGWLLWLGGIAVMFAFFAIWSA